MPGDLYNTLAWETVRAAVLARDSHRCVAAWLLGGSCDDENPLHVHHIEPAEERPDLALVMENLISVCAHHHPRLEALRRAIRRARHGDRRRCPHEHRTRQGREACEARLNRTEFALA